MPIAAGEYIEYLSFGLMRAEAVKITPKAPTEAGLLSFYREETTGDGSVLQTVLYENVPGHMELL